MALSSDTIREFAADHPTVDLVLPLKASQTIYAGAALEWNAGYIEKVSGSGTFAGFALEGGSGGSSDGTTSIRVRVQGCVKLTISTDSPAQTDVGVNSIEATDDNTFRIETGAAITGTAIGKISQLVTAGSGGAVWCSFKASAFVA